MCPLKSDGAPAPRDSVVGSVTKFEFMESVLVDAVGFLRPSNVSVPLLGEMLRSLSEIGTLEQVAISTVKQNLHGDVLSVC